ncbi:HNH endonuclease [Nanchangia anserum]|uniref:HNH endonuclease n=2 Tax=Nanchangia anserum TaxID=2692125 RepID=A0A8I0G8V7_9ACTO|nr:HNH endonuclease [Nanchangia anserum]QOX82642.1 HNH endonuclease [Nanchangia anserum]
MTDLGRRDFDPTHLSLPGGREIVLGRDSTAILAAGPHTDMTQAIAALPVRETSPGGYNRDDFGVRWADEDHNGCDTRNDVLARDLSNVRFKPGTHDCIVVSGDFVEPYTGRHMRFTRGRQTSEAIQIDHVVALADAWRSGANAWDAPTRQRFANDPLNLLAVDGEENQEKSAQSADAWLPANSGYHCAYVARQVAVKREWGLSVTEPERRAMAEVASTCPNQPLPTR